MVLSNNSASRLRVFAQASQMPEIRPSRSDNLEIFAPMGRRIYGNNPFPTHFIEFSVKQAL